MKKGPNHITKIIAVFLSCCILANCTSYRRIAPQEPKHLDLLDKTFVLHHGIDEVLMTRISVDPEYITGLLVGDTVTEIIVKNDFATTSTKVRKLKPKDKVHLYLNAPIEEFGSIDDTATISYSNIETIEVYEKEKGKTLMFGLGNIGILGGVVFGILMLIVALTKSSCPFIYIDTGTSFEFTGEIFSGATFPQIERHDYLRLPEMKIKDGNYRLLVTNEVKEIQHINLMELMVVDHEIESEALIDKYGTLHICKKLETPLSASNASGNDILQTISHRDSLFYLTGSNQLEVEKPIDYLILNFQKPMDKDSAHLLIRAKNHSWLDYSYMVFHDQLGKFYAKWLKKQQKVPAEELHQWSLDQKIPLAVYIKKNGTWQFADIFNIAGPMAMKDDILPLDLSGVTGETVTLKLETGFRFWEIDFAALDFSSDKAYNVTRVPPSFAMDLESTNVREKMSLDDDSYYIQEEVGEEANVNFKAPGNVTGMKRTIILHSKGYYEILMDPPDFRPRLSELKKLYGPLQFTQFSKDYYLRLYHSELSANE